MKRIAILTPAILLSVALINPQRTSTVVFEDSFSAKIDSTFLFDITNVEINASHLTLTYTDEGIICRNDQKKKNAIKFFKNTLLKGQERTDLELFIRRHPELWNLNKVTFQTGGIHRNYAVKINIWALDKCNSIHYSDCHNKTLDSLIIKVSNLIPEKHYNDYKIDPSVLHNPTDCP